MNRKKIHSKLSSKRGQIETMGLLVVVILVSLIIFFVLSFNINRAKTQPKNDFNEVASVSNFGTTILETDACGRSVRQLLEDCAYLRQIKCGLEDSCFAANETISNILDRTFNLWGYEYNLSVTDSQDRIILSTATGCNQTGIKSRKEFTPFSTNYGDMSITIKTC